MRMMSFFAALFAVFTVSAETETSLMSVTIAPSGAVVTITCAPSTDLPEGTIFSWDAFDDGVLFAKGILGRLEKGAKRSVSFPTPGVFALLLREGRGGVLSLRVRAAGLEAQCEIRERTARALDSTRQEPTFERQNTTLQISGREVDWRFDLARGELTSLKTGCWFQREWLSAPPRPVLPGDLRQISVCCCEPVVTNGELTVVSVERWGAGRDSVVAYDVVTHWAFRGDGLLVCQGEIRPAGRDDRSFQTGWRFDLDMRDDPSVECFAKRPFLARAVLDKNDFSSMCCYAIAYDAGWDHFSLVTGGAPFAIRADGKGLFAASSAPDTVGDRRFSFVLHPQKRFATPRVRAVSLPPTVRRITLGTLNDE